MSDDRTAVASQTASLSYDGQTIELPVVPSTDGAAGLDISGLTTRADLVTLDIGFKNTAASRSAVTFVDGDVGILRYRGYPIEQLAEHSNFLEVAYLLIFGELPTAAELSAWGDEIAHHTLIHEEMRRFFDSFPYDAHPMAVLSAATVGLSTFYQDSHDIHDRKAVALTIRRLIAKVPTIASWAYKKSIGQPYVYPRNDLDYVSNYVHMMFAVPAEPYEVHPEIRRALEQLLIMHADHEQNCSASTVRMVGSSHANLYATISAGMNALWGPLHGGANEQVIQTLERIVADGGNVQRWIDKVKDPQVRLKLPGFGHPVYKAYDPRAKLIKQTADRVMHALGADDTLFEVARQLEEAALRDDYFIGKKLYPNVDFYSGLIYRAIGFPKNMYTALFAIGRLPGWIAQWKEMVEDPEAKIGRPRQVYVGKSEREYVPIEQR